MNRKMSGNNMKSTFLVVIITLDEYKMAYDAQGWLRTSRVDDHDFAKVIEMQRACYAI